MNTKNKEQAETQKTRNKPKHKKQGASQNIKNKE